MSALEAFSANFSPVTFYDIKHETEEKANFRPYDIVKAALEALNRPVNPVIVLSYLSNSSKKKYLILFAKEDPELPKLNQLFDNIHKRIAKAETILDVAQKKSAKFDLALTLAKAGDINGALQLVDTLSDSSEGYALSRITETLIDFNEMERAKWIALGMEDSKPGRTARLHVCKAFAKAGKIKEALKLANAISSTSNKRDKALQSIIEKLSDNGEFDQAIKMMKDMFCCVDAREKIMLEMFKRGFRLKALQLLESTTLGDKSKMDIFLSPLSKKLCEEGFQCQALNVIQAMSQIESKYYQYANFIYDTQKHNAISNVTDALHFFDLDFLSGDKFYDEFSKSDIYVKDALIEIAVQKLVLCSEIDMARDVAQTISSPKIRENCLKAHNL